MRFKNSDNNDGEYHRKTAKHRRVDCIKGDEEEGCKTVCYSPARIIGYRLLSIARKCRSSGRREKIHEIPAVEFPVRKSVDRRRINVSGLETQEMSFNLAAGLGLLSLIAASKTELDKTAELRKRMEIFLESFKEENQSKATTPKPSDPEIAYAVSTTLDGLSNYSVDDHAPSFSQQEYDYTSGCDAHYNMCQKNLSMEGINHIEAELEAELDRMHLDVEDVGYVETGELSEIQEQVIEMPSENTANNGSVNMSMGEVIDPNQFVDNSEYYYGVPPLELERRLHEVLETRQEERIKELEAHLERMKRELQEKEVEVTWWKDTAKLISKQVPDTTCVLR